MFFAMFQAYDMCSAMAYIRRSSADPIVHVPSIRSLEQCSELIQQALFSIPSNVWMNSSRRNVRSDQHTHADQILLGLYSGVQSRGRLQFTRNTFKFPNLTRLILRYIQLLPHLQDFECTSIQINRIYALFHIEIPTIAVTVLAGPWATGLEVIYSCTTITVSSK